MSKTRFTAEPGSQTVSMSRLFDAPRDLVFKAYTDPDAIPQWWGPRSLTTVVDEMDARRGGRWRFVQRDGQGNFYGFHGVYHDVVAPNTIVSTFEFEGMPGHVLLETATFEDHGGKTLLMTISVFQSVEDRDGMLSAGMESGATESWDRLAEYCDTSTHVTSGKDRVN